MTVESIIDARARTFEGYSNFLCFILMKMVPALYEAGSDFIDCDDDDKSAIQEISCQVYTKFFGRLLSGKARIVL